MKIKILGGLLIALLAVTSVAEAQSRTPYIRNRERAEHSRINAGIRNGRLSYRETVKLRRSEQELRRAHYMARRDGYVSPRERQYLRHKQNQLSKQIYRDKRDFNRW